VEALAIEVYALFPALRDPGVPWYVKAFMAMVVLLWLAIAFVEVRRVVKDRTYR
jgi:hypothetical protein